MQPTEYQDDGLSGRIAREWGVPQALLDDIEGLWELNEYTTNDDFTVAYFVQFDESVDRETLRRLGVKDDVRHRDVNLNAFDEPEQEDPGEHYGYLARRYKELGGAFGALVIGNEVILNPWYPSSEAADTFWRESIDSIPKPERKYFLFALSKLDW